eukprot:CAMPEP_0204442532 /NCGR_PEP_ID=MMETSP0470-20130426/87312_1 /ASSEMBLY_ACC=CAM_ASM_000385 /TAXON_ID=2969 /ORGANISM="Oxyrrhis marina" /LENGTH=99 /DNA_ID=CAMNT_0051441745 /DNA_START=150 /DNA_END=450 /DNA_ORIENTATION=+
MAGLALAVSLWVLPTRVLQMHTTCRGGAQCVALRMCQRHVQTEICLEGMGAWAVLMTDYSASGFNGAKVAVAQARVARSWRGFGLCLGMQPSMQPGMQR